MGHSYTYAMSAVASTIFCKMCFSHEGKIVTIDQLTYYEPASVTSLDSIISSVLDKKSSTPPTSVSPRVYKDSSLLGSFRGPTPLILEPKSFSVTGCPQAVWYIQSTMISSAPCSYHPSRAIQIHPPRPPPFVGVSPFFP